MGSNIFPGQNKLLITCPFGEVRNFGAYIPNLQHEGSDQGGKKAVTPILAEVSGIVTIVANWKDTYGNVVIIETDMGHYSKDLEGEKIESLYGHNFSINVKVGDRIEKGQQIAVMGNSGYCMKPVGNTWVRITEAEQADPKVSSGTHSHFTVRTKSDKVRKWFELMDRGCSIYQWGRYYIDPAKAVKWL
jgi:murein DD-endopeptidase MepM/ murein hydrolase activator NlpD